MGHNQFLNDERRGGGRKNPITKRKSHLQKGPFAFDIAIKLKKNIKYNIFEPELYVLVE